MNETLQDPSLDDVLLHMQKEALPPKYSPLLRLPYPGLRPFEDYDAPVFFGRETHVAALLSLLQTNRFVAVVGASGSGKSSLVRAGLIPAIQKGYLAETENWRTLVIRPGAEPYQNLGEALVRAAGPHQDSARSEAVQDTLRLTNSGLSKARRELGLASNLLVVVDQFEEIFAFRNPRADKEAHASGDEAADFVRMLLSSFQDPESPIWIVLTMRSDSIGECEAFLGLPKQVSESQFLVPRLGKKESESAIVKPSKIKDPPYGSFTILPDLVTTIINEAGDRPDLLPLMQHALMRTWKIAKADAERNQTSVLLTEDHYDQAGRIAKSLNQDAENAWMALGGDCLKENICRRMFLLLCEVAPGSDNISRRRPTVQEVCDVSAAKIEDVQEVIHAFSTDDRNFIFVSPDKDSITPGSRLDVCHESLLRQWDKLHLGQATDGTDRVACTEGWLEQEKGAAKELLRMNQAAQLHREGRGALLDRVDFQRVQKWREDAKPNLYWALRYLDNADQWKAIESFLDLSGREIRKKEARKKLGYCALPIVLCIALLYALWQEKLAGDREKEAVQAKLRADAAYTEEKEASTYASRLANQLEEKASQLEANNLELQNSKTRLEELRVASTQRRDSQLKIAKKYSTQDTQAGHAAAMKFYIAALRADRSCSESIDFVCNSLERDPWAQPLTPYLSAAPGVALIAAAIAPDGKICAVSRDGWLLRQDDEGKGKLAQRQSLLPAPQILASFATSKDPKSLPNIDPDLAKKQTPIALLTASFSDDANRLVVFHLPYFSDRNATCQFWKWDKEALRYREEGKPMDVPDRAAFRNVVWSPDGNGAIFSRWDEASSRLYRFENTNWDYTSLNRPEFAKQKLQAAAFSRDGAFIAGVRLQTSDSSQQAPNVKSPQSALNPSVTSAGTSVPGAEIWTFDAISGQPRSLPGLSQPIALSVEGKPTQMYWGPGQSQLTLLAWTTPASIPKGIDTKAGDLIHWSFPEPKDQITRLLFWPLPPDEARQVGAVFMDRVEIYRVADSKPLCLPIKLKGASGLAFFHPHEDQLLTLSGPNWAAFDAIRLWNLEVAPRNSEVGFKSQEGDIAPLWLADLAEAVSGAGGGSDDEEEDSYPQRRTLKDFLKKYTEEPTQDKYRPIWDRFIENGRPRMVLHSN